MKTYTIADIETAINIWRERQQADGDGKLCHQARLLAAPYAMMIVHGKHTIHEAELTVDEHKALQDAFKPTGE